MTHFKQIIELPDKVSNTIFNLPCVLAVEKSIDNTPIYRFRETLRSLRGVVAHSLRPGDFIGQDQNDKWYWLTKRDYLEAQKYAIQVP